MQQTIVVSVVQAEPEPAPVPTLSFYTSTREVMVGNMAQLHGTTTNATHCEASGDWTGTRSIEGDESVGAITANATFTLRCSGLGGEVVVLAGVSTLGTFQVSWQAPTHDVDGSPVGEIVEYRLHQGQTSSSYDRTTAVGCTTLATTLTATLSDSFVAISAIDIEGMESAMSNETVFLSQ